MTSLPNFERTYLVHKEIFKFIIRHLVHVVRATVLSLKEDANTQFWLQELCNLSNDTAKIQLSDKMNKDYKP